MSEFIGRSPEQFNEHVRRAENEVEEHLRELALADTLFHDKHLVETLEKSPDTPGILFSLEADFLIEKRGKNFGERFDMALSEKYLGKIHVIELGSTTNPSATGAVDGLRDQYLDLLSWMEGEHLVTGELSREESGRTFDMRSPILPEAKDRFVVVARNRPLIRTEFVHHERAVRAAVAKRMVFFLPEMTAAAIYARAAREQDAAAEAMRLIELMLDEGTGGVQPIRTAYYLATDVVDDANRQASCSY